MLLRRSPEELTAMLAAYEEIRERTSQMNKELRRQERGMIHMEQIKMAKDIMIFSVAISFWTSGVAPGNNFSRLYSSL